MPSIKEKIKSLYGALTKKGSFTQNLAVTIFGSGLSLVIGFLFTPFIARIYGPEEYGLFSLFNAFATNITLISSLGYVSAVVLPKKENQFMGLMQLVVLLTLATSLLSLVVFVVWGDAILEYFDAERLGNWLYLIPVIVLIRGVNQAWNSWNTRTKEFKRSAGAKIASTLVGRSFILGYGILLGAAPSGLIFGGMIEQTIDVISKTGKGIRSSFTKLFQFNRAQMAESAKEYKNYPLFMLPSSWLTILIDAVPVFVLTRLHGAEFVGYYAFANSLLNLPLTVIGMSSARVFYQKATETHHNEPERLKDISVNLYKKLLYLGLLPFGLLTVYGDWIFTIILGDQWEMAGVYAGFMGFYFMVKLIEFPMSSLYRVLRKEHWLLTIMVSIFVVLIGTLITVGIYANTPQNLIIAFSGVMTVGYLISSVITLNMLKVPRVGLLVLKSVVAIIAVFAALYGIRMLIEHLMQ